MCGERVRRQGRRWRRRRNLILLLKNSPERPNINKIQSVRRAHAHPLAHTTHAGWQWNALSQICLVVSLQLESNRTRRPSARTANNFIAKLTFRLCPSAQGLIVQWNAWAQQIFYELPRASAKCWWIESQKKLSHFNHRKFVFFSWDQVGIFSFLPNFVQPFVYFSCSARK